jgi:(1->4)-alpha-D-glucan 1-alpha-D-glucosylmutase
MQKATREAKLETSWLSPDPGYDEAVTQFVNGVLGDAELRNDLREFCARIGPYAALNGLSRTLLRCCSPGIPDAYQGVELWHQAFVDPDNRAPVDYGRRRELLAEITSARDRAALLKRLLSNWQDGAIKLFVTHVALEARRSLRQVFLEGDYTALLAGDHVVAFSRSLGTQRLIVGAPRLARRLTRGERRWPLGAAWGDQEITLPAGRYRDAFTGRVLDVSGSIRLAECFAAFPLFLLVSVDR